MRISMQKESFNFDTNCDEIEDEMMDAQVHSIEPTAKPQHSSSESVEDIKQTKTEI